MSSVVSRGVTNELLLGRLNHATLQDRVGDFVSYIRSNSYTMYSAIKRLSSLEFEIRLMLDYFEDNKSEVLSEVINIKECLMSITPSCKDRVIVNIVSEIIDNVNEWEESVEDRIVVNSNLVH